MVWCVCHVLVSVFSHQHDFTPTSSVSALEEFKSLSVVGSRLANRQPKYSLWLKGLRSKFQIRLPSFGFDRTTAFNQAKASDKKTLFSLPTVFKTLLLRKQIWSKLRSNLSRSSILNTFQCTKSQKLCRKAPPTWAEPRDSLGIPSGQIPAVTINGPPPVFWLITAVKTEVAFRAVRTAQRHLIS